MMLISHDLSVLGTTCDRVAVMYAGRVVEEGPADAAVRPTRCTRTPRALAAAFPRDRRPGRAVCARGLPGDPPDPRELPRGCAFHPRCPLAIDDCADEPSRCCCEVERGRRRPPASGVGERTMTTVVPTTRAIGLRGTWRSRSSSRAAAAPSARRASTVSTSTSRPARSSRWSGSRAAARRRWPGRCSDCERPSAGEVCVRRRAARLLGRGAQGVPAPGAAGPAGPAGALNPRHTVYEAVAEGMRIHKMVGHRRRRAAPRRSWSPSALRRPGCDRRSGSSCATRTSCPADSGSAW